LSFPVSPLDSALADPLFMLALSRMGNKETAENS
jgi:hypothetical protein